MYQYEVKYLSEDKWHTFTTMLYATPNAALQEAESFEKYLSFSQLSKKLVVCEE